MLRDQIIPKLAERTRQLKIGNGMDPGAEIGPIVTRQALERILYIDGRPWRAVRSSSSTAGSTQKRPRLNRPGYEKRLLARRTLFRPGDGADA